MLRKGDGSSGKNPVAGYTKVKSLKLRQEVYKKDACKIADWLKDDDVTKFLNESHNVTDSIRQTVERVNLPVMTHLFNQNGSFFVVCTGDDEPVGFLRLVPRSSEAEMVVVIGDKNKWGKGFGTRAVEEGLRHAFFEWRVKKVIAKIHNKNKRSIHVFHKIGFKFEKDLPVEKQYALTMNDYLKLA